MLIGVLSDTHAPRFWKKCPEPVAERLQDVDVILHAGDICEPFVLDELARFAPVHAVKGNNDRISVVEWGAAPETLELDFDGVSFAMIHDSGPRQGRYNRMRKRFPDAQAVVYGHSHIPMHDEGDSDLLLFNPGSPTDKRAQPHRTMGLIEVDSGSILRADIVTVDP